MEWTNLQKVLDDYGVELRNLYQDNLIRLDAIATGDLLNDVEYEVVVNENRIKLQLKLQDYWKYIEYGTKPHWPPVSAIEEWIKVKPVLPKPINGKLPTPKQLAYLIGRKISQKGTKAKYPLTDAISALKTKYEPLIYEAIKKDVNSDLGLFVSMYFSR